MGRFRWAEKEEESTRSTCVTNEEEKSSQCAYAHIHTHSIPIHRQQTFETMLIKLNDLCRGLERNPIRIVLKARDGRKWIKKERKIERNMAKIGGANGTVPENSCIYYICELHA